MTYDRRAELRDIAEQNQDRVRAERSEHRAAASRFAECPPGSHRMTSVPGGGGVCSWCGFVVSREEIA